jgi:hypothetical protein
VDKYRRFLASKLLLENLMISGLELGNPAYPGRTAAESGDLEPGEGEERANFYALSRDLHRGLNALLTEEYGMKLENGRWLA